MYVKSWLWWLLIVSAFWRRGIGCRRFERDSANMNLGKKHHFLILCAIRAFVCALRVCCRVFRCRTDFLLSSSVGVLHFSSFYLFFFLLSMCFSPRCVCLLRAVSIKSHTPNGPKSSTQVQCKFHV